ncbi:unnamed protein product [Polarella glacialis]|uniref:Uncharacterized protein n=1 Tax=Polarella glacialis TaxID=89957 RepID=A0A813FVY2_POLGL|nr:unnamed protein product [Polarella glacialis]
MVGGCNCKVDAEICERLVSLAAELWEQKSWTRAALEERSVQLQGVAERAAAYLSQALLSTWSDDPLAGPDSPPLGDEVKEQATRFLLGLIAQRGRIRKRVLRGLMPGLGSRHHGKCFFTAELAAVRALGELVAQSAIDDPQLVTAEEVGQLVKTVRQLIDGGPFAERGEKRSEEDLEPLETGSGGPPALRTVRFVDLGGGWQQGQYTALLLEVVSKALEYRLLLKERELDRDAFEDSFHAAHGLYVVIPLIQAPPEYAEPALLCLATLAQTYLDNVERIVSLRAVQAVLGLPSPESKPVAFYIATTLRTSAAARKHAAKLLVQCSETQVFLDLVEAFSETCVKELVKLTALIREDGISSLGAFHDMMNIFQTISRQRPASLGSHLSADMLHLLVRLAAAPEGVATTAECLKAREILHILRQDRHCQRLLVHIMRQAEEGYDPEAELKQHQTQGLLPVEV